MKPKAAIILDERRIGMIYPADVLSELAETVDLVWIGGTAHLEEAPLKDVEFLFSGWGCPRLDASFLDRVPKLKAVFYGAGTVKGIVTEEFWERGIRLFSAWGMNAVPVAEFTFAQILLASRQTLRLYRSEPRAWKVPPDVAPDGNYRVSAGLVSLGQIGMRVARFLQETDLNVHAYHPFCLAERAKELAVELVDLETLFRSCRVVSIHTPWLPETEGMITGALIRSMPPHATLINTSRGAVINEPEMISALQDRRDLTAILDVVYPEPPSPESPLLQMENVFLTPHIAGSIGNECARMGREMIAEFRRYLGKDDTLWEIDRQRVSILA